MCVCVYVCMYLNDSEAQFLFPETTGYTESLSLTWSCHFSVRVMPEVRYGLKISIFILQSIGEAISTC